MTDKPKRRPRWLQFSLRTLLIVVLLLSLPLSWFAVKLQNARKQRDAVAVLANVGGYVTYSGRDCWHPIRRWYDNTLGIDFFAAVDAYDYWGGAGFGDDEARYLNDLPSLTRLYLVDSSITNVGLENIKGLTRLRDLDVTNAEITDAGLETLQSLTNLEYLAIDGTRITPEGVKKLREALPNCEITY